MRLLLTFILAGFLMFSAAFAQEDAGSRAETRPKWDKETVKVFGTLPIQEGGRVKPISTYALYTLLKLRGLRGCPTPAGEYLKPTEWLMDCMFYPNVAAQYKVFLVDSSDVLVAIGLPYKKKRDRYSYLDLLAGRDKLLELSKEYSSIDGKKRTPFQSQVVNLWHNLREYESLSNYFQFARAKISADLSPLFNKGEEYSLAQILDEAHGIREKISAAQSASDKDAAASQMEALRHLFHQVDEAVGSSYILAFFPPPADSEDNEWKSVYDVVTGVFYRGEHDHDNVKLLQDFTKLAPSVDDRPAFALKLGALHSAITKSPSVSGLYKKVKQEHSYHQIGYFSKSRMLFIGAFVIVALSWLIHDRKSKTAKLLVWSSTFLAIAATVFLSWGMTMRCIIRSRPPVTTLYETILFITAVAVATALFIEYVNRRRIGLSIASALGVLGLYVANKYELQEAVDTMPSMVAVLDSNFWLSTHVTTIAIGYAAGFLASAIAHVYVIGKAFGIKKDDAASYKNLARMVYGVLCFGLLFNVVGTVLGGVWANESWGRFWGWDPKENGALLIVLWQLLILHARLGGYIRDYGVCMLSIFGGIVVAFSWFGVNLLNVGLHTYGFNSSTYRALLAFYSVEGIVLLVGSVGLMRRAAAQQKRNQNQSA